MFNPKLHAFIFVVGILSTTACGGQDSKDSASNEDSTADEAESSDSTATSDPPRQVRLEDQPGYKVRPYGSCPDDQRIEESCDGEVAQCRVMNREHPLSSVCVPPCVDGTCPPSEGHSLICTEFPPACAISCKEDKDCPKGMFCENPEGTRYCAWPVLWEE